MSPTLDDERRTVEPLPDLGTLGDDELKRLIDDLTAEEQEISFSCTFRSSINFLRSSSDRDARSGRGSNWPPFGSRVKLYLRV